MQPWTHPTLSLGLGFPNVICRGWSRGRPKLFPALKSMITLHTSPRANKKQSGELSSVATEREAVKCSNTAQAGRAKDPGRELLRPVLLLPSLF